MKLDAKYRLWMQSDKLTPDEKQELMNIEADSKEIESRFISNLCFGTAGLRGILGMGTNRMNRFTVAAATQSISNLICDIGGENMGVAIAYDCRIKSDEFAKVAATIFAANGINVLLFDELRPTPQLSFAIRHYGCIAGINITASHNPKEYNGYKVYWQDGAQLPPNEAKKVADVMDFIDPFTDIKYMNFEDGLDSGIIKMLSEESDEIFLDYVASMSLNKSCVEQVADEFKLVYTPFHGAGYRLVPEALRRLGYKHIICVDSQMKIDGNFPTVKSPNPEDIEGFNIAIGLARENNVDLIIGTDPDADRVGVVVKNSSGEYSTLSGNQVGVLLLDYIIKSRVANNTMPSNPAFIKTIVTTEMSRVVAEKNNVACYETFTGFKFMAEKIKSFEESNLHNYIFAYEESYGYLCGDGVRDKDAVTASMLIAEMAAYYKIKGLTLFDAMQLLYTEYGYFLENTISITMSGLDGIKKMDSLMTELRKTPPKKVGDVAISRIRDYLDGYILNVSTKERIKIELQGSNVIYFEMEDGSSFIIRPSGTEPKIKIYIMVHGGSKSEAEEKIEKFVKSANMLIK